MKLQLHRLLALNLNSPVFRTKSDGVLALTLLLAIFLWGGNNIGTQLLVRSWPPVWTGGTRFFCAGLLLLGMLHWTKWLGTPTRLSRPLKRQLWLRGGLGLAAYIICFNWALRFTSAAHVALYLGASPVWALLWEGRPAKSRRSFQRYGAAVLTLIGVLVLFWPALRRSGSSWIGELLGITVSVLWTSYGRQCRALGAHLSGAEVSAHTMWRAGLLLLPFGLIEVVRYGWPLSTNLVLIQLYCISAGGVVAFGIWSYALRRWPTSQVLLFNNLIPLSTTAWAYVCLNEPLTVTFKIALTLIVTGVLLGQIQFEKTVKTSAAANSEPEVFTGDRRK